MPTSIYYEPVICVFISYSGQPKKNIVEKIVAVSGTDIKQISSKFPVRITKKGVIFLRKIVSERAPRILIY